MDYEELFLNGFRIKNKEELENFVEKKGASECHVGNEWYFQFQKGEDYTLDIEFSEDGEAAFIGWFYQTCEEMFYFDNGSNDTEPVKLIINDNVEKRMMCHNHEIIKEIVYYFCETGKYNPKYNWVEDV